MTDVAAVAPDGEIILILPRRLVEVLISTLDREDVAVVLAKAQSLDAFDRRSYATVMEIAQQAGKLSP